MTHIIDLTGQQFGRLTITGLIGRAKHQTWWRARCSCGKDTVAATASLRRAARPVRSCGCLNIEATKSMFAARRGPARAAGKECRACGAGLPLSSFYERADTFDGMHHICRTCFIADINARRQRRRAAA